MELGSCHGHGVISSPTFLDLGCLFAKLPVITLDVIVPRSLEGMGIRWEDNPRDKRLTLVPCQCLTVPHAISAQDAVHNTRTTSLPAALKLLSSSSMHLPSVLSGASTPTGVARLVIAPQSHANGADACGMVSQESVA